MDAIEILVWIVFVVGWVFFNLVQWRRKRERQHQRERAAAEAAGEAHVTRVPELPERPVPHPKLPVTYREQASPLPSRMLPRVAPAPSPWADTGWGRHAEKLPDEVAEDLVEAAPAPLPLEVPTVPVPEPVAPTLPRRAATPPPPRVQPATRRATSPVPVQRRRLFRTSAEVRSAIVGMTVLGPCRALDPYAVPEAGSRPGADPKVRST